MKKIASIAAAMVLCLALAGCSQNESLDGQEVSHQEQQSANSASSGNEASSAAAESEEGSTATTLSDSLRGLDYEAPAGWEVLNSSETAKSYTNGRALIQITTYDAPTSLEDEDDSVVQLALLSSLKGWEGEALNGLKVDKELTKINGLRMQGAQLERDQDGTVFDMRLATFQKKGVMFILGISAPASMGAEDIEAFSAFATSCK